MILTPDYVLSLSREMVAKANDIAFLAPKESDLKLCTSMNATAQALRRSAARWDAVAERLIELGVS